MQDIRMVIETDSTIPNRLVYVIIDHPLVMGRTIQSQIRSIAHVTNLNVAPGQVVVEVTSITDRIIADIRDRLISCLTNKPNNELLVESVSYREGNNIYECVLVFEDKSIGVTTRKKSLINVLFRPARRFPRQ